MTDIIIRKFQKRDGADVARQMRALAAFHGEVSRVTPAFIQNLAIGKNKALDFIVALKNGRLVGFAATSYGYNVPLILYKARTEYLYVEEDCRGQGVGKMLVHAAIQAAYKKGCDCYVISATPLNKLSNRVYKALGLTHKKNTKMDYQADKAFMKQLLRQTTKDKN